MNSPIPFDYWLVLLGNAEPTEDNWIGSGANIAADLEWAGTVFANDANAACVLPLSATPAIRSHVLAPAALTSCDSPNSHTERILA